MFVAGVQCLKDGYGGARIAGEYDWVNKGIFTGELVVLEKAQIRH